MNSMQELLLMSLLPYIWQRAGWYGLLNIAEEATSLSPPVYGGKCQLSCSQATRSGYGYFRPACYVGKQNSPRCVAPGGIQKKLMQDWCKGGSINFEEPYPFSIFFERATCPNKSTIWFLIKFSAKACYSEGTAAVFLGLSPHHGWGVVPSSPITC